MKHVYANPKNPHVCAFLALAIHLCWNANIFEATESIFRKSDNEKKKVASSSYCSQLKELLKRYADVVLCYIRLAHGNAHGYKKGAATYATSGTTCPPPIPSVAQRGEWSLGRVLDVYWHCLEPGEFFWDAS